MLTLRMRYVFAIAAFCPLVFALYTNNAWDDWYITYRASKNLAIGNGLVFTPGQHVHSFTSPLGVLIPAALSYLVGNSNDDLVLWLFRLLNSMLLGVTALILFAISKLLRLSKWATVFLLGMAVLDGKTMAFSINGMETAILLMFLAWTLFNMLTPINKYSGLMLGLSWAGLMWSRPDGFVYILSILVGYSIFVRSDIGVFNVRNLRTLAFSALVVLLVYGPWLVWAWHYYGSFIPHTIVAKGLYSNSGDLSVSRRIFEFLLGVFLIKNDSFSNIFMPPYALFGSWPIFLIWFSKILGWVCAFAWLIKPLKSLTKALSFAVFILQIYLNLGMRFAFPWYLPPVAILSIIVASLIIDQLQELLRGGSARTKPFIIKNNTVVATNVLPPLFVVSTILITLYMSIASAYMLRTFQSVVYDGNYKNVGIWLQQHAANNTDRVFLEPLGYIGFFSNLKMLDYPGLSSPEVVAVRKQLPPANLGDYTVFADLIKQLRPEWLVLRPREVNLITGKDPSLLTEKYSQAYESVDAMKVLNSYTFLPGRKWFEFDHKFIVYQRK